MNKLNYEILSAIDNIDNAIIQSEMNVVNSLMDSYGKAVAVLEYCDDNTDVDSFDIFQESVIMEADENKNDSKLKKIINKIIDAFMWLTGLLIDMCKKLFKHKKRTTKPLTEKDVELVKQSVGEDKVTITISQKPESAKPEVKVSSASHDTEIEEHIKSKIEQDAGFNNIIYHIDRENYIRMKETSKGAKLYKMHDEDAFRYDYFHNLKKNSVDDLIVEIDPNGDVTVIYGDFGKAIEHVSNVWQKIDDKVRSLDADKLDVVGYVDKFVDEFNEIYVDEEFGLSNFPKAEHYQVITDTCLGFITRSKALSNDIKNVVIVRIQETLEFLRKIISKYKKDNNINHSEVSSDSNGQKPKNYIDIQNVYIELDVIRDNICWVITGLERINKRIVKQELLLEFICEIITKKSEDGKDYYKDAKREYDIHYNERKKQRNSTESSSSGSE